jgi:LmbE family N-acetylglucosaminyl deacetylase
VLAVGAHPDDIELGCGAALIAHRLRGDRVALLVMTTGEQGPQHALSRVREQQDAADLLGAELFWGDFSDGDVPEDARAVAAIESVMTSVGADTVYTHAERDTHQDHRSTARATLAACRRISNVLCYESPTTIDFSPDVFVDADGRVEAKVDLLRAHMSQVLKNGLVDLEGVEAQARYRGFTARLRWAEAFESHRFVWDLGAPVPEHEILECEREGVVR